MEVDSAGGTSLYVNRPNAKMTNIQISLTSLVKGETFF